MVFNPTIDLGSLLTAITVIGSMIAAMKIVGWRVGTLEKKVDRMDATLAKVAVQDNRLNRLEADVRELRHGEGMVLPLHPYPHA